MISFNGCKGRQESERRGPIDTLGVLRKAAGLPAKRTAFSREGLHRTSIPSFAESLANQIDVNYNLPNKPIALGLNKLEKQKI